MARVRHRQRVDPCGGVKIGPVSLRRWVDLARSFFMVSFEVQVLSVEFFCIRCGFTFLVFYLATDALLCACAPDPFGEGGRGRGEMATVVPRCPPWCGTAGAAACCLFDSPRQAVSGCWFLFKLKGARSLTLTLSPSQWRQSTDLRPQKWTGHRPQKQPSDSSPQLRFVA